MLKKSLFLTIILAASFSESSELSSFAKRDLPSPLCQEVGNLSFNMSSSGLSNGTTPMSCPKSTTSQSPLIQIPNLMPLSIDSLKSNLINHEQETREEIAQNSILSLMALNKKSAEQASKKIQKKQKLQTEIIKARRAAVRQIRETYPSCELDDTQVCPRTNELFYTKSGRTVPAFFDIFKRNPEDFTN